MTQVCGRCGRANRDGAAFCGGCGQKLVAAKPAGAPTGQPAASPAPAPGELGRYVERARATAVRLLGQAQQEATGWYHDLVTRQPELTGEVSSAPAAILVTRTVRAYALLQPVAGRSTQESGVSFSVSPQGGGLAHPITMVGAPAGILPGVGDKVRAWGVWDRDLGELFAWRLEVYERNGRAANELITTARPFPWGLLAVLLVGFLLLACLCSLVTG